MIFTTTSKTCFVAAVCLILPLSLSAAGGAQNDDFIAGSASGDVLTFHNDNFRTGQYLSEFKLTPETVNASSFGKLFTVAVDGKVDAQPLYVSNLAMSSGRKAARQNVIYTETEHDSVAITNRIRVGRLAKMRER